VGGTALAGLLGLTGCSLIHHHWFGSNGHRASEAVAVSSPASEAPASDEPSTRTVTDTLDTPADRPAGKPSEPDLPGTTTVVADVGPELKPTAPKSYVVRRGDTLWGIANMFLRDPWTWPEIWYVNPQIQNPHRIYPGDQVRLALASNGRTELQLVRAVESEPVEAGAGAAARLRPLLRSAALTTPIETIPYSIIAAFLSHPTVLTSDQIRAAPYVVALAQNHNVAGTGHELFINKLSGAAGSRYSVMHVDEPLINPDDGHQLGYMAIYTGTAELLQAGHISKAILTQSSRETLQGDVLIPEEHTSVADFVPHMPEHSIDGRIIAAVDNVLLAGQNQVVAINRGSADGLERGHVLTVDQAVQQVRDPCANIENSSTCSRHPLVTLPTDTAGTLLIFRTFEHLSYALILNDTVPMQVGSRVRSP
jgi:LysM repeat protein